MSYRINHNVAAINSHRQILNNNARMGRTLEKLSSGMKINRAADGPASLAISERMRAQIAGLRQAIDNSETAVSLIQTTEANMAEVNNLLISIRQLAIHAANEGVNDAVMLEADQNEIANALETIARISKQAQFGTKRLLDGSRGAAGNATGENLEFVGATLSTGDSREQGVEVRISRAATRASISGTVAVTSGMLAAGERLTVVENGRVAEYVTTEDDTRETMIQNLQSEISRKGLDISVELDESGRIRAYHNRYGSGYEFQVLSSSSGVLGERGGKMTSAAAGLDVRGTIEGESAVGKGRMLTGIRGARYADGLSVRYYGNGEDLRELAGMAEPNSEGESPAEIPAEGVVAGRVFVAQNSLRFQVGANRNQSTGISVEGVHPESLGRGVSNASEFASLADVNVRTYRGAQDTLALVDAAIDRVAAERGRLGAFQKNTLESNLSNLRVQSENLIDSESVIRDVDMAAEMAEFTRGQIMTQASTAMLAQANQLPQNVLSLLG